MALVAQAYKYYRLLFKGSYAPSNNYASFAEFKLFENADAVGTNLCTGAVATSSGSYSANTQAPKGIDNNTSTYYESENASLTSGGTCWFKIELPEAKVIRSYHMIPSSYTNEFPVKFEIQGSNDNTNWDKIYENNSVPGTIAYTRTIASYVGGISRLTNGQPTQRILITNWLTGAYISTATPSLS